MLKNIEFNFGATASSEVLRLDAEPSITIFVGPNNSGKTQALQDIATIITSGHPKSNNPVVRDIEFHEFGEDQARSTLRDVTISNLDGEYKIRYPGGDNISISPSEFIGALLNPNNASYRNYFTSWYASKRALSLDGPSRVNLIEPQPIGDLKNPTNPMSRMLVNNPKRDRLKRVVYEAVGMHLALDMTQDAKIHARFAANPPPDERNYTDELIDYMRDAKTHRQVSDGVKAFVGLLLQLHAGDHEVVLVDEPEAFLHPTLAYSFGKEVARGAVEERKFVFAATHSAHFLMGAIASGARVNVVRLSFNGVTGSARHLRSEELIKMMRNPMLRSIGVLEALFHAHVIVTEADADRAFYQEINHRLISAGDARGIPHALFLNANGKQTIPTILAPLRKLGIPAAGIADIDFLNLGGSEFVPQIVAMGIPAVEQTSYQSRRKNTDALLRAEKEHYKRHGGIRLLTGQEFEAAENLLCDFARYGMFVVPHGEAENWLEALPIERSKHSWLRTIFERMGEDPSDHDYVRPSTGDVWDFLGKVADWMRDGERRGVAS